MMTDRGRTIARRVREAIQRHVPEDLGSWDGALPLVRGPTHRFLDALEDWEAEDTRSTREDLQQAADTLVQAWAEAGRRYRHEDVGAGARQEVPA